MVKKELIERLIELIRDDKELHDAVIDTLDAYKQAEISRMMWYERRKR